MYRKKTAGFPAGGGSLDIDAPQSIANHKDITFDGVTITAATDADGSIVADGNITIKNNTTIDNSGTYFGFNVGGDMTITNSNVTSSAIGDEMNAFYVLGKIVIEENSTVNVSSQFPSLFSRSDISIADSMVTAESTKDWGVWAVNSLSISGDSEVIATGNGGSIGAKETFKIIPSPEESVDVYSGADADSALLVEGTPFSEETDLKALEIGKNPYFYSVQHVHTADA